MCGIRYMYMYYSDWGVRHKVHVTIWNGVCGTRCVYALVVNFLDREHAPTNDIDANDQDSAHV